MFTDSDLKRLKVTKDGDDEPWYLQPLLARLEAHERLNEWLDHDNTCIRSFWCAGRPTEDGGYEEKFGHEWYELRPVNKTPKCDCGLGKCLEAWLKAAGRDSNSASEAGK